MRIAAFAAAACLIVGGALCAAELQLTAVDDATGEPVPVRVHLRDARGRTPKVDGTIAWNDHFVMPGQTTLNLPPGKYTFEMERGPEYRLRTGTFELKRGDADAREVRMVRIVDMRTEGWWSGDLHIHRAPEDIELLMLAEDLHVAPVITWWNDKNLWKGKPLPDAPLHQFDTDRFYHVMAGEDERGGGALLYLNGRRPLDIAGAAREYPALDVFLREAKKDPQVHVDLEKPFWWDAPTLAATGLIDSIGLAHNHMQRSGVLDNEAWGRPRDKSIYRGPTGNGRWTTDIYYHLLNCGLRIPPSA
ncbi:MAG: hypothetical protein KDA41_09965, partial [Planctomycetales bacterium]|nr:hypothetical protein [Planctomycetales bacterium]